MKSIFTFILLSLLFCKALYGQSRVFQDSATVLNKERIRTNQHGMKVLGAWGAVNLVSGVAGMVAARMNNGKRFMK